MDITSRLREEHQRVQHLFERCAELDVQSSKKSVVLQLLQELSVHETAEETAVYSDLRTSLGDAGLIDQAVQEQAELKQLLQQLNTDPGSDASIGLLGQVQELVMKHVATEEQKMFPLIEQKLDEAKRTQLCDAYDSAKIALVDRMAKLNVTMLPETPVEQQQRR